MRRKTKTFAQLHAQEDRLHCQYAITGYRWQKIHIILERYKDAYFDRFGFAVCSNPELYNHPLTRKEYAGY